jgi:hypothetical protein
VGNILLRFEIENSCGIRTGWLVTRAENRYAPGYRGREICG